MSVVMPLALILACSITIKIVVVKIRDGMEGMEMALKIVAKVNGRLKLNELTSNQVAAAKSVPEPKNSK